MVGELIEAGAGLAGVLREAALLRAELPQSATPVNGLLFERTRQSTRLPVLSI